MKPTSLIAAGAVALAGTPAVAQTTPLLSNLQPYASVSAGVSLLADSDNDGAFSSEFETGAGAGLTLPAGTDVGWTTEFDEGFAVSGALGARSGALRGEVEVAYQDNNVDTHSDVGAGGLALDALDAGVLITGSDPLGVTVGDLVADGQGAVSTLFVMANGYYDFELPNTNVKPYVGAGVGVGFVDVDYSPSGVTIIDDDATAFAYQAMAGASLPVTQTIEAFAGYRYRGTTDVETSVSLFPAELDIENRTHILEVGVRFAF